jgi:hypothetical protein
MGCAVAIKIHRYFVFNKEKREVVTDNLLKNWDDANAVKAEKNTAAKHWLFDVGVAEYQNGRLHHTDPGNLTAPKFLPKGN